MLRLAAFAVTSALAAAAAGPLPRCPRPWAGCWRRPTASPSPWPTPGTVSWTGSTGSNATPSAATTPRPRAPAHGWTGSPRRARTPSPPSPSGRCAPRCTGAPPLPASAEPGTDAQWTPRFGGRTDAKSAAGTQWNLCFRVGVPDLGRCAGWAVSTTLRPPRRGAVALDSSRDLPVVVVREEARREQQAIPRRCSPRSNTRRSSGRAVARQRQRHGRQREFDRPRGHGEPRHGARRPRRARPPARVRLQTDPRLHAPYSARTTAAAPSRSG